MIIIEELTFLICFGIAVARATAGAVYFYLTQLYLLLYLLQSSSEALMHHRLCSATEEHTQLIFQAIANHVGRIVFLEPGMWKRKRWKRSFFCGSGSRSAKILPLPLPHRLFDLKSNLAKQFCPFPNVD